MPQEVANQRDARAGDRARQAIVDAHDRPRRLHPPRNADLEPERARAPGDFWVPAPPHGGIVHPPHAANGPWAAAPAPMQGLARPDPLRDAVDTHRAGADRDTQRCMLAVFRAFPVTNDEAADTLDAIETFIVNHVGGPTYGLPGQSSEAPQAFGPPHPEDSAVRHNALRTLGTNDASRMPPEPHEEFLSLRDPRNTYLTVSTNGEHILPTQLFAAAAWKSIDTLPQSEQHAVRMLYVLALAASQQQGHICAPGQLQQIAAYLAASLPALFFVPRPPRKVTDYTAELFRFIKQKAGGATQPVPTRAHHAVRAYADKVWRDLVREDEEQTHKGYLDAPDLMRRAMELRDALNQIMNEIYDLNWPLPSLHTSHEASPIGLVTPGPNDFLGIAELLALAQAHPARFGPPRQINPQIIARLLDPRPTNDPYGRALLELLPQVGDLVEMRRFTALYERALQHGQQRWPNDVDRRVMFDREVRRYLMANFRFIPVQRR